jgi:hypothetical protein
MQPRSEASIEKSVCEYAKKLGCMVKKVQTGMGGSAGWPDRLFHYHGRTWYIEFKRTGGKLTDLQKMRINELQTHKIHVYTIDDVELGKQAIDYEVGYVDA